MTLQFAVLGSGSRGNSTLICEEHGSGLLIDVGLGPRTIGQRLESVGSCWSRVRAVLLTHTHGDHLETSNLPMMARHDVTLYCHEAHRDRLADNAGFRQLDEKGLIKQYDGQPFLTPCGFRVEPIPVRHDGGPTFGFRVESVSKRRTKAMSVGYVADTGSWSDAMADSLTDVDVLGVEFNHDVAMQRASGRSPALIARVLGDRGHLSNCQAAELVRSVLARSRRDRIGHLVLLHLSEQCNRPELAVLEALAVVEQAGRRTAIHAARQAPAHPNLAIRPHRPTPSLRHPSVSTPTASSLRRRPTAAAEAQLPGLFLEPS